MHPERNPYRNSSKSLLRGLRPRSGLRRCFPGGKVEPSVSKLHLQLEVRGLGFIGLKVKLPLKLTKP